METLRGKINETVSLSSWPENSWGVLYGVDKGSATSHWYPILLCGLDNTTKFSNVLLSSNTDQNKCQQTSWARRFAWRCCVGTFMLEAWIDASRVPEEKEFAVVNTHPCFLWLWMQRASCVKRLAVWVTGRHVPFSCSKWKLLGAGYSRSDVTRQCQLPDSLSVILQCQICILRIRSLILQCQICNLPIRSLWYYSVKYACWHAAILKIPSLAINIHLRYQLQLVFQQLLYYLFFFISQWACTNHN